MNMVIISNKLLRFSRRQVHTIVLRDIIKPSFPTPSHSKTYNLSLLDQLTVNAFIPVVALYPNSSVYQSRRDKTLELKKSLSQTLTHYYPFAGRMKNSDPTFVDCNDEGVEFIEACNTSSLSDFLQQSDHEDLDQLFPDDLIWFKPYYKGSNNINDENHSTTCPLTVQVNHFACGGVAVATSLRHKIGDASSALNFIKNWAANNSRSRAGDHQKDAASPIINPHFISHQPRTIKLKTTYSHPPPADYTTKSFVFPNTKIKDLKAKVAAMSMDCGRPITNPTRVEVLTWLLCKCQVAASNKTNSGNFKQNLLVCPMNLRNKLIDKFPETSIGNLVYPIIFPMSNNHGDVMPHEFIGELRRRKLEFQNKRNLETIFAEMSSESNNTETVESNENYYLYSSICGFPMYDIDFGWGKPIKVTIFGGTTKNFNILMDTPNGNGIQVQVSLTKQDMNILLNDPDLLPFC